VAWRRGLGGSEVKPNETEISKPDLTAVLGFYDVQIRGTRGMAKCPFHEDRTPSFSYDDGKGVWNCHSCGQGGDAWTLIQLKEECDFKGALAFATKTGLSTGDIVAQRSSSDGNPGGTLRHSSGSGPAGGSGAGFKPRWRS
jgi:hypothetical protein